MLQQLSQLPPRILQLEAHELLSVLKTPTLIHLEGDRQPALFVSVLLHGNETVGWDAIRALLRRHGPGQPDGPWLPRALSLFIGNVEAAATGLRHLTDQPDYNRVWPGSELAATPEHGLMAEVIRTMAGRGVFASVDIHNNTGCNPHYACVNLLDNRFLHLATLFSRTVVYFLRPRGVQSMAMARFAPSVTLECGKVGEHHGVEHAAEYLDACLRLSGFPRHPVPPQDIDLFHTVAQVKVPGDVTFNFLPASGSADILFEPDLDRLNFRELPRGSVLGRAAGRDLRLEALDELGRNVTERYLQVEEGEIRFKVAVMPSMLTRNASVIRQDCLCYLMERYNDHLPGGEGKG